MRYLPLLASLIAGAVPGVTAQSLSTKLTNPIYVQTAGIPGTPTVKANLVSDAGFNGLMCEDASSSLKEMATALHARKNGLIGIWRNAKDDIAGDHIILDTAGPFVFMFVPKGFYNNDAEAAAAIAVIADRIAPSGRKIAIYPHAPDYVSNSLDAAKIAKLAKRANVGISFNLCHELMYCNVNHLAFAPRLDSLVKNSMPYIFTASISGGDSVGDNWGVLIRPLGEGTFNLFPVVQTLMDHNFKGPFLLQAFGINQDAKTHLAKSMIVWKDFQKRIPATTSVLGLAPRLQSRPTGFLYNLQGRELVTGSGSKSNRVLTVIRILP